MSPEPVPGTPSPSGEDAADRTKPDFTEQIKTLGLAGAIVTAVVAGFKGATNSPEFKKMVDDVGAILSLMPSVLKDELTADSGITATHRAEILQFEQRYRTQAEEERSRAFPRLRCRTKWMTALFLPLYPVRWMLWFMIPAPLWTAIRRSAEEAPAQDRGHLRVLFGATKAYFGRMFQLIKLEVVFAYVGLLVVELVKWVGTILFGIWCHTVVYNAWHTLGDEQTRLALIGLWVWKVLFPIFGFWLVANALHYAYWLRMFPNLAIVGGLLGFLRGSRPRPKAKDSAAAGDNRGMADSIGEGAGNMVFTWSTKGQNEGMWYNVCAVLLLVVPFFMFWHPAFMFVAAVAVMLLWQASTNLGNNMTAEGYRVVEDKTYEALADDVEKPGQKKVVTGHKYARAPSHWYVVYGSIGVVALLIIVSFVNFGTTVAALSLKEAREKAVAKLTEQEMEAFSRDQARELNRLQAAVDKIASDMRLRDSLVAERSQVDSILAPDGTPARLRMFNAEKQAKLRAIDAKLAAMADLRTQYFAVQNRIVAVQSVDTIAVRDSINESVGEAMTAFEAVGIAGSSKKMTTRERYNFKHQEWVRAVRDSLRWRADSLRMREAQSRLMTMPSGEDSASAAAVDAGDVGPYDPSEATVTWDGNRHHRTRRNIEAEFERSMPGQFVEGLTRMRWFGYGFAATYFGTLAMAAGALFLAIKGAKWPWFPSLLLYGFLIWLFPNVTGLFFTIGFMLISAVYVLSQGIQLIKSEKGLLLLFTMMAYAFGIWALHTMVEFPTMIATVFATLGLVTFLIIANDRLRPQPAH